MNKTKTHPNVFATLLYTFLLLFFPYISYFVSKALIHSGDLLLLIPLALFVALFVLLYLQVSNFFTYVRISEKSIKVYQPLKFKAYTFDHSEISGYSTSEVGFGKLLWSSKSFIIYSKNKNPFEIIKFFNSNFENTFNQVKQTKIVKFGAESYQTGIFYRKFKYDYLIKNKQ